jgi:hypothetical protein
MVQTLDRSRSERGEENSIMIWRSAAHIRNCCLLISLQSESFMPRQLRNAIGRAISKMASRNVGHLTFSAVTLFAILVSVAPLRAQISELKKPAADDLLADLRSKRLSKPEEIFKHAGMTIPIETLLSGYRETVMSMVRGGQGTVEDKGNVIVGTSCIPNECDDKSLMFALDPTSKKVFFAWKTPGEAIYVKPTLKEWTSPARAELSAWSERWTTAYRSNGTDAASRFHPKINGSAEEAFGHKIQLSDSRLIIDGKTVLKSLSVYTSEKHTINGVGVIIGEHFPRAAQCAPNVFVVSFPKDQPYRLHSTKVDCSPTAYEIEKDGIRFFRSEDYKPKTWTWTPEKGMSAEVDLPVPNQFQRFDLWQDLSAGRVEEPWSLFRHPQMKDVINTLVGKDKDYVEGIAYGTGDIAHKGNLFVATACAPHACFSAKVILVFDTSSKGIFIAWKSTGSPPVVRPSSEQWTPQARVELNKWMKEE